MACVKIAKLVPFGVNFGSSGPLRQLLSWFHPPNILLKAPSWKTWGVRILLAPYPLLLILPCAYIVGNYLFGHPDPSLAPMCQVGLGRIWFEFSS